MRTLAALGLFLAIAGVSGAFADSCPQDRSQQDNQPVSNPNLVAVGTAAQAAGALDSDKLQKELESLAPPVAHYAIPDAPPLEWEKKHPVRKLWSDYAISVVNMHLDDLDQAQDIGIFCTNYPKLTRDQRVLAWAQLFVGISRWESSWNPTERTLENQGIDVITHKQVYSEGLLQLSYQDITGWHFCKFDWEKDKKLRSNDLHRTIFNPYNNLYCGIGIMATITHDTHSITNAGDKHYWSTLEPHGSNSKIPSITAELRRALPFCGPPVKGSPLREDFTRFANLKINRGIVKIYRKTTGIIKSIFKTPPAN